MRIIMPTCDKYRNIIEANKYTMDKFGGSELDVTVLGYKKPDFDIGKWNFVSLGNDVGANHFTNDIWKFFENFNDEFFIYGNDDVIAVDSLDMNLLLDMEKTIRSNDKITKICVTSAAQKNFGNYDYSIYEDRGDFKYIVLPQNAEYRLSLHYGIWKTSYFKKYFQFNINPWDWELRNIAKNDGAIILGTTGRHFLDFGHILRRGGRLTNNWHFSEYTGKTLSMEDINFVTQVLRKI